MAKKNVPRRKDHAKSAFFLCMLSVILVFAFGLVLGKQNPVSTEQTASIQATENIPTENNSETEIIPSESEPPTETHYRTASNFWSEDAHVYLRVNHSKLLNIGCKPDVNLSSAYYTTSDESIALVDEFGTVTGVSRGECIVCLVCGEEVLQIPLTVREMTVQNGCTYVDGILIANKEISLPEDYDPGMLPETEEAFHQLQEAAKAEGLNIYEGSGYRSYDYQVNSYNSLVRAYGEEYANRISAKPGHSEHQTGYTVDCNTIDQAFIETPEGQWLDQHCHEFGFIIRYPAGKEDITGYDYECWHIRYLGVQAATEIYTQGLTLEEYLDVVSISQETSPTETQNVSTGEAEEPVTEIVTTEPVTEPVTELMTETTPEITETTYPETETEAVPADGEIMDAPLIAP